MMQFSACKNTDTKELLVTEDTLVEEHTATKKVLTEINKPFENLVSDDVVSISIFEASLESDITLSEDDTLQMVSLLNELVTYQEAEEEERIGQMVQVKISKSDGSLVVVKCFSPYLIIDDVWYEAEYQPMENIDKFVNDIMKR